MKVTIHQPNYLPWLGFFDKVAMADVYVILDSVQYEKDAFSNRNKIRVSSSPAGWAWLTVPVKKGSSQHQVKDVEIDTTQKWRETTLRVIQLAYKKAPFFKEYEPLLEETYNIEWHNICDLNIYLITALLKELSLHPTIIRSSTLDLQGKKSDLNLDICKKTGATTYISGISGKNYLDIASFKEAGIDVFIQEYKHPVYKQVNEPFIPNMCTLDLLMNYGPDSLDIITGKK